MSGNEQYATEIAQWKVKSGFWTLTHLIDSTVEVLEFDESVDHEDAERLARQIVIQLWNEQLAVQESWPEEEKTIAEKLAAAFDSLEKNHKIPARMNFTCCRTCGVSEIGMDREEEESVGYAFFHEQTTEGFVKFPGSGIMIYYGKFRGSGVKCEDVAKTIVRVLRRAGLSVDWDGDTSKAMEVRCDEWRKRLIEEEEYSDEDDSDHDSDDKEQEEEKKEEEEEKEE
ncbi:hypothetical protein AJ78_03533 [Emergomyces pasteurianus Ep9510]|uniref:DUF6891 domain-containing protein n=1 Tax=Emergomyces pasteurianus Ep9510 TaxID=1447872 RepID=A0A1J9PK78_9EURO|nr:hypothetical protein AJ78_03533 [Emergomyces pasteurianus Ep9510]